MTAGWWSLSSTEIWLWKQGIVVILAENPVASHLFSTWLGHLMHPWCLVVCGQISLPRSQLCWCGFILGLFQQTRHGEHIVTNRQAEVWKSQWVQAEEQRHRWLWFTHLENDGRETEDENLLSLMWICTVCVYLTACQDSSVVSPAVLLPWQSGAPAHWTGPGRAALPEWRSPTTQPQMTCADETITGGLHQEVFRYNNYNQKK